MKDLLSNLFLFNHLNFQEIDNEYGITDSLKEVKYKDGETILSADERICGIAVVASGKALILAALSDNSPTLRTLSRGDTFGAASLFSKDGGYSTVVRADGECKVFYIPEKTVLDICENLPAAAMNYISFLSGRVTFLNKKVTVFSQDSPEAKTAVYLYELFMNGRSCVSLPVSYSQLSDMLGIGRASLYRSLDSLCDDKIIERNGKKLTLLQPDKLKLMIK